MFENKGIVRLLTACVYFDSFCQRECRCPRLGVLWNDTCRISRLGRLTSFTRFPCRSGTTIKSKPSQNLAFICLSSAHPHAIVLVSSAPGWSPFLMAYYTASPFHSTLRFLSLVAVLLVHMRQQF